MGRIALIVLFLGLLAFPVYADTVVTTCNFTVASDTLIGSYTCDSGEGWISEIDTCADSQGDLAAVDANDALRKLGPDNNNSCGLMASITETRAAASYKVAATITLAAGVTANDDPAFLVCYFTDTSNFVIANFYPNGATTDARLHKNTTGGGYVEVATYTTNLTDGATFTLECIGDTWKVYEGAVEIMSHTCVSDCPANTNTKVAAGMGATWRSTDDIDDTPMIDNLVVTEIDVAPSTIIRVIQ